MKSLKTFGVFILFVLFLSLVSCAEETPVSNETDSKSDTGEEVSQVQQEDSNILLNEAGKRIITLGTWYDIYYVSKHDDINDDPQLLNPETAQMRLDRMREVEKKYNIELRYVNLTFDGIQESINTSILAGDPDVDIYEVDIKFGIPAVLKGYCVSLEDMELQDTDVFTTQDVFKYLRLMEQDQTYLFTPTNIGAVNAYVLAFNMDMINAAGLDNPQDLYDRGEWTWSKWKEYLGTLTQDTNHDGKIDIYGFSGYWIQLLANLLLSNGTGIASGEHETLSSSETYEVLDFINSMYNIDNTARPWDDSNWSINNELYSSGLSAFWIGADWLFNEQGGADLPFEIGVVPWPCGPSGDFETNRHSTPQTKWYMIPNGVSNPRLVYDVIFDWINWYNGDISVGVNLDWSRSMYMSERNFEYAMLMDSRPGFDLWENLGVDFNLTTMMKGDMRPNDVVERYGNLYQNALDNYFN
jgi:ABC-type sugar transport system, periplasmic component